MEPEAARLHGREIALDRRFHASDLRWVVPEGDTLHRLARKLGPLLVGGEVARVSLPRRTDRTEGLTGTTITGVEARGKNLLIHFSSGLSLHTHLQMHGSWRVVPRPVVASRDVVAIVETKDVAAICVRAPVARLLRTRDIPKDLAFRDLGPDLLGDTFDEDEALRRLARRAHMTLGEALLDQSALAGIGNVWKSELCFNLKLDPLAPVSSHTEDELRALVRLAREQLLENVIAPRRALPDPFERRGPMRTARRDRRAGEARLSVYERAGERCFDCGSIIEMQRQGEMHRSTYWCPGCQPRREKP
jgi:endonuclease-8